MSHTRIAALATSLLMAFAVKAQTSLPIPDTLSGSTITLSMHKDSVQFFPGKKSYTYAYNQFRYLGPTLILRKGTNQSIVVNNNLGDTTTVHWHGIHIPAKWDGGPHSPILPASSWNPQFTVMDHAATYWYHPHLHMKTASQAIKGAAGLIIVKDAQEAALALPRTYGVDDIPLVVQCQEYDTLHQAMPRGMQDSIVLVNGARANYGYTVNANLPAQIVRLRLLNASGERVFNFGFSANKTFSIIASDGGLLNAPAVATRIRLAPGERAEVLLDLSGMLSQTLALKSYGSELPMGVQGGPTMPMPPPSPPMDSPLNGIDYALLKITVVPQTTNAITVVPQSLVSNSVYPVAASTTTRSIRISAASMMSMDGPFFFNDSSFNMMRIDYTIPINNVEVWKIVNRTMVAHPFHIHDVQFNLLRVNGAAPLPEESGRKDVVLVTPMDTVIFITKFEDFADTIPYMYHCHILMHEDDGMMGQFVVSPKDINAIASLQLNAALSLYPNPVGDKLVLQSSSKTSEPSHYSIHNVLGQLVAEGEVKQECALELSTANWVPGVYTISYGTTHLQQSKKFVKQ